MLAIKDFLITPAVSHHSLSLGSGSHLGGWAVYKADENHLWEAGLVSSC